MRTTRSARRACAVIAVLAGLGLVASACTDGETGEPPGRPDVTTTTVPPIPPATFPFVGGEVSTPGIRVYLAGGLTGDPADPGSLEGNAHVVRLGPDATPDRTWLIDLPDDEYLWLGRVVELMAGRFLIGGRCRIARLSEQAVGSCTVATPVAWQLLDDGTTRPIELVGDHRERGRGGVGVGWMLALGSLDGRPLVAVTSGQMETPGADLVGLYLVDVASGRTTRVPTAVPIQRQEQACVGKDGVLRVLEPRLTPATAVEAVRVHERRADGSWTTDGWAPVDPPARTTARLTCLGDGFLAAEPFANGPTLVVDGSTGSVTTVARDAGWAGRVMVSRTPGRAAAAAIHDPDGTVTYRWVDGAGAVEPLGPPAGVGPTGAFPAVVLLDGRPWDVSGLLAFEARGSHAAVPLD